jgi:hypothetical protein
MIEKHLTEKELAKVEKAIAKQAAEFELPDDLRSRLEQEIEDNPELPWDAAIAAVVDDLLKDDDDEEAGP